MSLTTKIWLLIGIGGAVAVIGGMIWTMDFGNGRGIEAYQRYMCDLQAYHFTQHPEMASCYHVDVAADPAHGVFMGIACANPRYADNPINAPLTCSEGSIRDDDVAVRRALAQKHGMDQIQIQNAVRAIRTRCLDDADVRACMARAICRSWEVAPTTCRSRSDAHWHFKVMQGASSYALAPSASGRDDRETFVLDVKNNKAVTYNVKISSETGATVTGRSRLDGNLAKALEQAHVPVSVMADNLLFPKETRMYTFTCPTSRCNVTLDFDVGYCVPAQQISLVLASGFNPSQFPVLAAQGVRLDFRTKAGQLNIANIFFSAVLGQPLDGNLLTMLFSLGTSQWTKLPSPISSGATFLDAINAPEAGKLPGVLAVLLKDALESKSLGPVVARLPVIAPLIARLGTKGVVAALDKASAALWVLTSTTAVGSLAYDCAPANRAVSIEVTRNEGVLPLGSGVE